MRIVLDANIFVAASISPKGICGEMLITILSNPETFELIMTEKIANEALASLNKPKVRKCSKRSEEQNLQWIEDIYKLATIVADLPLKFPKCRDIDDVVYLSAADVSRAETIVTWDKDLLVLENYKITKIIPPPKFMFMARQMV